MESVNFFKVKGMKFKISNLGLSLKSFFISLPSFLRFVIKEPFYEVKELGSTFKQAYQFLKSSPQFVGIVSRPKYVVYILLVLVIISKSRILFLLLVFSWMWKLWVAGKWREEERRRRMRKLASNPPV